MFCEIILFFVTICLLVYFNDYLPVSIQTRVDNGKLCVVENAMYAMLHVVKKVNIVKSDYVWENRSKYSTITRTILDYVMGINTHRAYMDVSTGKDSISIINAYVIYNGTQYDALDMLDFLWSSGDGIQITCFLQKLLGFYKVFVDIDSKITLVVKYAGHSNKMKRIESGSYTVKYCGFSNESISFPPYPSTDSVKKGLGKVRVIDAKLEDGTSCTENARESAGVNGVFYRDLASNIIQKNVVTLMNDDYFICEGDVVTVVTSKGTVICNEDVQD